VCDASGTRTGGFNNGKKIIVVLGSNKIVPNLEAAYKRQQEFCFEMESARVRKVYKFPSSWLLNSVTIHGGHAFNAGRFHFVIIKESLGF
jgi:hypothetical protein